MSREDMKSVGMFQILGRTSVVGVFFHLTKHRFAF